MQLTAADIDRIDALCAALEENLGEATRRGADIETDPVGDVDAKMVERGHELDAAARYERMRGLGIDDGAGGDRIRGLADDDAVRADAAGGDGGLGPRAALKQAACHQQAIGALTIGHDVSSLTPVHAWGSAILRHRCSTGTSPKRK